MSPSSIFSSDTLRLESSPRPLWRSVVLAFVIVTAAETGARILLHDEGREWQYWSPEAAVKFETYRRAVETGPAPSVVIVGDSTAARDIDPRILSRALNRRAYSLAYPGAFALAFRDCVAPLLLQGIRTPDLVVAMFSPGAFVEHPSVSRFEQTILSSPVCASVQGRRPPVTALRLTRLWAQMSEWRHGIPRSDVGSGHLSGFMPLTQPPGPSEASDAGNVVMGRETAAGFGSTPTAERLDMLRALVSAGRARGFDVAFVLPPVEARATRHVGVRAQLLLDYLSGLKSEGVLVLNYMEWPALDARHFVDGIHLNVQGAELLSRRLGEDLRGWHQARPPQ